jgi:hypothetical protein
MMSTGYYTSDTPVSRRVDVAWSKGYEQGLNDGRSLRYLVGGVILGAILERVRPGRLLRSLGGWSLAFLPWLVLLAAVAVPLVLAASILWALVTVTRAIIRASSNHRSGPGPTQQERGVKVLPDGSTF